MNFNSLYLLLFVVTLITSCQVDYQFEKTSIPENTVYELGFELPCDFVEGSGSAEINAVKLAMYGETKKSINEAGRRIKEDGRNETTEPNDDYVRKVFQNATPINAITHIVDQASKYHFTLINEAHFSSQNRAFTEDLLAPLWDLGYRYLALETFSHDDTDLITRGYPIIESGYYSRDSHFGNLIRAAIELGYIIVPYDTERDVDGTERDLDQAKHIITQTILKDSVGKVLVHAGYGHITEVGFGDYVPLGASLKELVGEDILTIDQERMLPYSDNRFNNAYLNYILEEYNPSTPLILLDNNSMSIRDEAYTHMLDLQVYHPNTNYINGRPDWMLKGKKSIALPDDINSLEGYHLRAIPVDEDPFIAIPVDQFKIDGEKYLVLPIGKYAIEILDCNRLLHSRYLLNVE